MVSPPDFDDLRADLSAARGAERIARDAEDRARRATEDALALMRSIVDHAFFAIIVITADGGIVREWNPAAEALYGATRQEVMGRPSTDFIQPTQHIDKPIAERVRLYSVGLTPIRLLLVRTGEIVSVEVKATRLVLGDGTVLIHSYTRPVTP